MQAQPPKVDITVHLGKQTTDNQQTLAHVIIRNHTGQAQIAQVKQNAKITQVGNFMLCLLKYSVYPGRENQASKYLEQGFQQSINRDQMSPLQFITRKYDSEFALERIYTQPGFVCVEYKFKLFENLQEYDDQCDFVQLHQLLQKLKEFRNTQMELLLRGYVSHSLKNRTNVKVDYTKFNFNADQIDLPILHNMLTIATILPNEMLLNPFYSTVQKAKKLHLSFRFKSFRQINKYFDEINELMGHSYKKKQEKQDFRYVVPGLFRQKVEGYLFLKEDFALSADISHHGEEVFMRLVKVYFKAAKKGFEKL